MLYTFSMNISSLAIKILFDTNPNEVKEFLRTYINIKYIIMCFLCFYILKLAYRKIKNIFSNMLECIFKIKILKLLLILLIVFKMFNINMKHDIKNFSLGRLYFAIRETQIEKEQYEEMNKIKRDIQIINKKRNISNIVFIIGESITRNHMSLYGYNQETNPLLTKLEAKGNLYKFTDVISPHAYTIGSLKKVLTFYTLESDKNWYEYNNIIDIMKKAGYKTYWFSNQESSGLNGNIVVNYGKKSDIIIFNNIWDSSKEIKNSYDEEIVIKSKSYISKEKDNFIIYHLMGAHQGYNNRYPKKYDKFKNKNIYISSYDNAILYNDYVVNEIINNFKDEETIVFYISDHGEEVYDFRAFAGHSEGKGSKYMIEIPFFIFVSDKFKEKYPELVNDIENSKNKPYMIDDVIHTILDVSGITTKEFDERKSIINKNFNENRQRLFLGKDYETYWKIRD